MNSKKSYHARQFATGLLQLCMVIALILITFGIASHLRSVQPKPVRISASDTLPVVSVTTAESRTFTAQLEKLGAIEPAVTINLVPEQSGVVASIREPLAVGSRFSADDVLFELASEDQARELARRKAEKNAAAAALELEVAEGERARQEWRKFGKGSMTDLAARGPQIRSARAQLAIAQTWLETAEANLARTRYSLPFDGRVTELNVAQGQYLSAGQSYGQSYPADAVEVRVSLSSSELTTLGTLEGLPVDLQLLHADNAYAPYTGTVTRLSADADRTTRLITAFIRPSPELLQQSGFKPGLFTRVVFKASQPASVAEVPTRALQVNNQLWRVTDGRLYITNDVQVVNRQPDKSLVTGIRPGDLIALDVPAGALDGARVTTTYVQSEPSGANVIETEVVSQ